MKNKATCSALALYVVSFCFYGCSPIRMVIRSGSRAGDTHGAFVSWNPRSTDNLAKSGSIMLGILLDDGGSTPASPCPNTFAASIVLFEARLLTNTIIPCPNPLAAPQFPAQRRFGDRIFHLAPLTPKTVSAPRIFAIAPQVSTVSWPASPCSPQTNSSTLCPANEDNFLTSSGATLTNSFARGPWAAISISRSLNWADAMSSRAFRASASLLTASALRWREPTISCACSSCVSSTTNVRPSNITSPAILTLQKLGQSNG